MKVAADTDDPTVEVSVRQTEELSARGKCHPEATTVAYVQRAFERLDLPHEIRWDLPPVADVPDPKEDKRAALRYWSGQIKDGTVDGLAKDADLLLTTLNGGGVGYVGMNAAVCPAGTLTEDYATDLREWVSSDDPRHPVFGILHELGHLLGSKHELNWGRTWTDDAETAWYRTPCAHPGTKNQRGEEQVPRPEGYEKRDCLYFAAGAAEFMRFK